MGYCSSRRFCVQLFRERLSEKHVNATIPKGDMGYDQFTVPETVAVELTLLLSLTTRKHTSMASRAILPNFFEKPLTIPIEIVACTCSTTFLEIAVCNNGPRRDPWGSHFYSEQILSIFTLRGDVLSNTRELSW